jgi:tryptophan halogenase
MTQDSSSLQNIVVVGGGTAGWLSALYAKMRIPGATITVIESEDIGILGAGEGTTPTFLSLLDRLQIPYSRVVKEADATVKHSIKFTNWRNDGSFYYHGFLTNEEIGFSAFDNNEMLARTSLLYATSLAEGKNYNDVNFCAQLGENNKSGFFVHENYEGQFVPDPIFKYVQTTRFASHFDAAKLAKLFKKIAVDERGILRVEGKVVDQTLATNGDIESLTLEDGQVIDVDFLFDCTGFARKFIGKVYDSPWKSHKDKLTVDSAIPFFPEIDENNIPPYTEAIAMDYGWVWRIPLQSRYGSGYVFDSSLISADDAKKELDKYYGYEVESPRVFSFEAGYYENIWINNCIAVGLSSGFIEPLEATSIFVSGVTLMALFEDLDHLINRNQKIIDEFNEKIAAKNQNIADFVYFHYMSDRADNDFWKKFSDPKNAPEFVQNLLEKWEYRLPEYSDFVHMGSLFPLESWVSVADGVGRINKELYSRVYESNKAYDFVTDGYERYLDYQKEVVDKCVNHTEFLNSLK